jgi:hypothetical protein
VTTSRDEWLKLSDFQREGAKNAKDREEFIAHDHWRVNHGSDRLLDFFSLCDSLRSLQLCVETP